MSSQLVSKIPNVYGICCVSVYTPDAYMQYDECACFRHTERRVSCEVCAFDEHDDVNYSAGIYGGPHDLLAYE